MSSLVEILAVDLDGARGSVGPCGILNTGINRAARHAGAPFGVRFTLAYPVQGSHKSLNTVINVTDTKEIGVAGGGNVSFETSINLGGDRIDPNSHVMLTAVVVHREPGGEQEVGETFTGSFHFD